MSTSADRLRRLLDDDTEETPAKEPPSWCMLHHGYEKTACWWESAVERRAPHD